MPNSLTDIRYFESVRGPTIHISQYLQSAALVLAGCFSVACGGGGSSTASSAPVAPAPQTPAPTPTVDTTAPQINTRTPSDQATDISTTVKVTVVFDEPLDQSSVDAQSLVLTQQAVPVAGNVTYDASALSLEFTPDTALAADTVYGVSVASTLRDSAGNVFLGDDWFFATGGPFNLGATSQTTIDQCMDDGKKLMLTLVNNTRASGYTCGSDTIGAQPPLAWNCLLDAAALGHSTSMADNDFHAHVSPVDGSDPGDRIRATGYTPQAWGENIAAGYPDEDSVMAAWLTSPGHCANIMSSNFSEMGASSAANSASSFGIYWTQKFGRPL